MQDENREINLPNGEENVDIEDEEQSTQISSDTKPSVNETKNTEEPMDNATNEDEESEEKQKKSSISADLIRGHINTIILRTLYEGDRYGYDIINEIEQKSHGQYTLKQPTLYSALKRLESQGYIKSYWGGVSNGGRRRYFSLTEEGRKIAEKNQAEWEYSRTIIDSLISENDFDFSQPAPDKLDFRILRAATSRTPIVSESEAEVSSIISDPISPSVASLPSETTTVAEPSPSIITGPKENTETTTQPTVATEQIIQEQPQTCTITETVEQVEQPVIVQVEVVQTQTPIPTQNNTQVADIETQEQFIQPPVSQPTVSQQTERQPQTPSERTIPLFLTRTEEERNYKDILSRIYRSGIKPEKNEKTSPVDTTPPQTQSTIQSEQVITPDVEASTEAKSQLPADNPSFDESTTSATSAPDTTPPILPTEEPRITYAQQPKRRTAYGKMDFSDIQKQANYDGLRVWTAGGAVQKREIPEDFFNKGKVLFHAALIFFAIAMMETLLCIFLRNTLQIEVWFLIVMLTIACLPPIICGIMYLAKYQPCCRRLKNNTAVYNGIVAFVSLFILLVAIVLIADVNLMEPLLTITYLLIPFIYLLNVIVFAVSYYLLSRSKV